MNAEINLRAYQDDYENLALQVDALLGRARQADRVGTAFQNIAELSTAWNRLQRIEDACRTQFAVNMSSLALVPQGDVVQPALLSHEQKYDAADIESLLMRLGKGADADDADEDEEPDVPFSIEDVSQLEDK